jgi:hypothetical protein
MGRDVRSLYPIRLSFDLGRDTAGIHRIRQIQFMKREQAYRGDTLALRVKSIGQGAQLRMDTDKTGRPIFRREESTARASPIESKRRAVG